MKSKAGFPSSSPTRPPTVSPSECRSRQCRGRAVRAVSFVASYGGTCNNFDFEALVGDLGGKKIS